MLSDVFTMFPTTSNIRQSLAFYVVKVDLSGRYGSLEVSKQKKKNTSQVAYVSHWAALTFGHLTGEVQ